MRQAKLRAGHLTHINGCRGIALSAHQARYYHRQAAHPAKTMNAKLVESLIQLIQALTDEERSLLEKKLWEQQPYPSSQELTSLATTGGAFEFLHDEPDIYTLTDGEPIQ